MFLALLTVGLIYVGGVAIMVGTLDPVALRDDLTPVATAGEAFLGWLPDPLGLILVVIAAVAAFASTGNAGILTASRYPLAMARDELVWSGFDRLGRFGTPTVAVVVTSVVMILSIIFLDVERLAKLGSAFLLLIFALVNLAVIIMRESRIDAYAPGYRSPLYPWVQLLGAGSMLVLLATLGLFSLLFVLVVVVLASVWYWSYARGRVAKRGAIYTLFLRLGQAGEPGVDLELWRLLQERGSSDEDSYEELVARAHVLDLQEPASMEEIVEAVAEGLAEVSGLAGDEVRDTLREASGEAVTPGSTLVALFEAHHPALEHSVLALVRAPEGVEVGTWWEFPGQTLEAADADRDEVLQVPALTFLLSPTQSTQHLRILAELATQVEHPEFARRWRSADSDQELKEALLRHERFVTIDLRSGGAASELVGKRVRDVHWPQNALVAVIRRDNRSVFPRGRTVLHEGDRITVIGPPAEIEDLYDSYGRN
jgi:basic amino acid/polyamine antiporter, APA family